MGGAGSADPLTVINFFINIILEAVLLFINSRLFSYQCLKVKQQTKLRKGRGGGGRKEKGWFNLKQIMKCHMKQHQGFKICVAVPCRNRRLFYCVFQLDRLV